jgi:hypothetical protein
VSKSLTLNAILYPLELSTAVSLYGADSSSLVKWENAPSGVVDTSKVGSTKVKASCGDSSLEVEVIVVPLRSITNFNAPDGTPNDRLTIGVCELVNVAPLDNKPTAINWVVEGAANVLSENGFLAFEAKDVFSPVTATATFPNGETATLVYTVIPPNGINYRKLDTNFEFKFNQAGAGMNIECTLTPRSVSFENIITREIAEAAISLSGRYANQGNDRPYEFPPIHKVNPNFQKVSKTNTFPDQATNASEIVIGNPPSWIPGGFTWPIPNHYAKWDAKATDAGIFFVRTFQTFYLESNGMVTIVKGDASCERKVNAGK